MKKIFFLFLVLLSQCMVDGMQLQNYGQLSYSNVSANDNFCPNYSNSTFNFYDQITWQDQTAQDIADHAYELQKIGYSSEDAWEIAAKKYGRWQGPEKSDRNKEKFEDDDMDECEDSKIDFEKICKDDIEIQLPSYEILVQRMKKVGFDHNNYILELYKNKNLSIKKLFNVVTTNIFMFLSRYKEKNIESFAELTKKLVIEVFCKDMSQIKNCYEEYFLEFQRTCSFYHYDDERYRKMAHWRTMKLPSRETFSQILKNLGIDVDTNFLDSYSDTKISMDCFLKIVFFDFLDLKIKNVNLIQFPITFINQVRDDFVQNLLDESFKKLGPEKNHILNISFDLMKRVLFSTYKQKLEMYTSMFDIILKN